MAAQKRRGISSADTSSGGSATQLSALGSAPGTLTDELAALFECPVCFEIVLPPIMQCQVGHLVCASCRPKLSCCPTCRGTLGNIRNLAMEKVANNLMFPCKHKSTGCRMSLGLNEKAEHEEVCEFRPYSCPCPGASCSWQGQLDKVMVHLQHSHKNITTLNGEDIVFLATEINLAGAVDWVMMQSCFGHHFMLVLEKQEKNDGHTQFFAIVQLIGSRKQAERFAYRFDANKSTKGASKLRRDLINAEIANLRELLPLPPSTRQRLSQLQLMALVCVYVRKANYFQQAFKCHDVGLHQTPTPNIGFSKALSGFLMMMTQNGKLLYISDNAAEYLGHSMVSVIKEDLLIHGDSVYDIIDKQDHQAIQCELGRPVVNTGTNNNAQEESRLFLCRMNVSRNARRQMRFGDQKVVLVQGRYLSFLPLCSRNEPVFLATCTPVAMPETRECVVQGATNVFTSIHSMDMRFIHIDNNGEFYLGFPRSELQGVSWYRLLHWDCTREAQTKHRLITQSEQERSCILLAQIQRRSGDWLWMHCVLQVKESSESNQQPVIVCTNQVLSEAEAAVMRTNGWLYHYYSVQNKLHYGLAYDGAHPTSRLLYYPEHSSHGASEFGSSHDVSAYPHLTAMPVALQTQLTTHHAGAATHAHHNQHHHHHHHRRADSEPVDYSYGKRKPKNMSNLELDVETTTETDAGGGGDGLLVISHLSERPRTLLKVDPHELIDQWNPSPPWSDTLQKVPDLCHQELSPYVGSTPPTPTATPSIHAGGAFSFDWMPEQFVPSISGSSVATGSLDEIERPSFWPPSERQLFPLQPPPKRNNPSTGRSDSADRDTP